MRLAVELCQEFAVLTGLMAAFSSQASSPDYRTLFLWMLGETALSVLCAAVALFRTQGVARFVAAAVAALAIAGCAEMGARLLGVRLLG